MKKTWKILTYILGACIAAGMSAWIFLLGTICSEPRVPVAATGHTIHYNCHGSIVYITTLQDVSLHWLIPAMFVLVVLLRTANKRVAG